ncbi:DinB family protein [Cohnella nanjingensis]|uniref:DinB family protein n=1 Tax=Cohnella nanjingensis TaxID=1387779 RepID=A0A7X0VEW0_9BACL|nr:DinB family protein [Cohnella nanjingensis]MBB6671425.1 DinB family protein [Cohnella nanjingensis]
MFLRPTAEEYSTHNLTYIRPVPEGNLIEILEAQTESTRALLASLSEEQGDHRYAPDKWSIKEVIGHITDNERIMSYRLLRIARGDDTPLPGYDQEVLVGGAPFAQWTIEQALEDYLAVRHATLTLLRGLQEEAWVRLGTASEHPVSARALACIIVGHELHHLNILRERYLTAK